MNESRLSMLYALAPIHMSGDALATLIGGT